MYSFSKYKEQYKLNLQLAIPVVLSQLGQVIVQLADNIMVGRYGGSDPLPLAAVSFGGSLFFIVFLAIMGLTLGITPLVGELFAQRKKLEAAKYLQNGVLLYGLIAIAVTILQFAITPLMHVMGQPQDVVELAIPYYRTMVWSLLPIILFFTIKQFLEGIGNTRIAMYTVIISNALNILLNYCLIGGELGCSELGSYGAGVATLISRVVQSLIIFGVLLYSDIFRDYRRLFARCNFSLGAAKRLLRMGAPISLQIFLEASTFILVGFIIGAYFNAEAITANQIAVSLGNSSFLIIMGVSIATTIRISHCYGQRDMRQMRLASKAAWHLSIVWSLVVIALFSSLRLILPTLYTSNSEVIELTSLLMVAIAMYQLPDGLQCISVGILRGMQDVKAIPVIAFISYWLCNLPLGYTLAITLGWGVQGFYFGFFMGFSISSALLYTRLKRRHRELTLKADAITEQEILI